MDIMDTLSQAPWWTAGILLRGVEYAEMAKACGLKGVKVGSVAELEEAVAVKRKWMERGWNMRHPFFQPFSTIFNHFQPVFQRFW
jgi:hypothetical protein